MDNRLPLGAEHDPRAPYNQHEPEYICIIDFIHNYDHLETNIYVKWKMDGQDVKYDFEKYGLKKVYHFHPSELKGLDQDEIIELIIEKIEY